MDEREGNKALVRRFYAEIDAGNIAAMDEIVAVDYIDHSPPPLPDLPSGRDGLKKAFESRRTDPRAREALAPPQSGYSPGT